MISARWGQTCTQSGELCPCHRHKVFDTRENLPSRDALNAPWKVFVSKPIFSFDFKQLNKSNRGLIFDPSFLNVG